MKRVPAPSSIERVRAALSAHGHSFQVLEFAEGTRTAADAAAAVGCALGQIAKSLIFRAPGTDRAVLAIASGANRVDEAALGGLVGEPVERGDAGFVRSRTGYAIGGVAPVGLLEPATVIIDRDLMGYEEIWAAAGTPRAVFRLKPGDLVSLTGGRVADIKRV